MTDEQYALLVFETESFTHCDDGMVNPHYEDNYYLEYYDEDYCEFDEEWDEVIADTAYMSELDFNIKYNTIDGWAKEDLVTFFDEISETIFYRSIN